MSHQRDIVVNLVVRLGLRSDASLMVQEKMRLRDAELQLNKMDSRFAVAKIQAGIKWLHEGDAPSAYFFKKVKDKRKKDSVIGIRDTEGYWVTNPTKIGSIFVDALERICGEPEHASLSKSTARNGLLNCVNQFLDL